MVVAIVLMAALIWSGPPMASDLELLTLNILRISSPGKSGFLLERAAWEQKVRALIGEAFLIGSESASSREQEKTASSRREEAMKGKDDG